MIESFLKPEIFSLILWLITMKMLFFVFLNFIIFNIFADKIDYLSISGGSFDFMRKNHRSAEARVEYRPSFNLQTIRPIFGVMGTLKGSFYIYSGVGLDLFFTDNLYFSPSLAAGLYCKGGGKDLGFPIEFRSGLELGWRFLESHYRIAVHICHISNASLGKRNPGCESLVFSLYYPLKKDVRKCK